MARRLVFHEKQSVSLDSFVLPSMAATEVLVRTSYSALSTGTENILFNRAFEDGSHWDQWLKYPFCPGYASVGVVEQIGSAVENVSPGDRVALRRGHSSAHIVPAAECFPIPPGIDLKDSLWFAFAKIAFMGARAARHSLGDAVLVIGAGPIGQMAVRWAIAAGSESVLVSDLVSARSRLALKGGATHVLSAPLAESDAEIRERLGGRLPRVVIDSTGSAPVFSMALGLVASHGTVVLLGDTGFPQRQHLTYDVITRGISIVGAHDTHDDADWNNATITKLFFSLVLSGRMNLSGLITHQFWPEDCANAYRVTNTDRGATMGVIFDWTGERRDAER